MLETLPQTIKNDGTVLAILPRTMGLRITRLLNISSDAIFAGVIRHCHV